MTTPLPTTEPASRAERCETCRFWYDSPSHVHNVPDRPGKPVIDKVGECRRMPPVISDQHARMFYEDTAIDEDDEMDVQDAKYRAWPVTWESDWCGEWKPADVQVRPCKVCEKPMKIGPGHFQSNREFCSGACKQKDDRKKKKAAKEVDHLGTL